MWDRPRTASCINSSRRTLLSGIPNRRLTSDYTALPLSSTIQRIDLERSAVVEGWMKPPSGQAVRRRKTSKELDLDTLRPLVDLAYWSPFVEVRRDAAAAFSTLSMNDKNIEVLSQAGALGALLSLISVKNVKLDLIVLKDAATALSKLVSNADVKVKILNAPGGIQAVFTLAKANNLPVKRLGASILLNLVTDAITIEEFTNRGGIDQVLALLNCKDHCVKSQAAKLLKRIGSLECNKTKFKESILERILFTYRGCLGEKETQIRKDILEFFFVLSTVKNNALILLRLQLLGDLQQLLQLEHGSLDISLISAKVLDSIATHEETHMAFRESGSISLIHKLCFVDLPQVRFYRFDDAPVDDDTNTAQKLRHSGLSPIRMARKEKRRRAVNHASNSWNKTRSVACMENEVLRTCFSIFTRLVQQPENGEVLIAAGILDKIVETQLYNVKDRKLRRMVADFLSYIAQAGLLNALKESNSCAISDRLNDTQRIECAGTQERHIDLISRGILRALLGMLQGNDSEVRGKALSSVAFLTRTKGTRNAMCQYSLLNALLQEPIINHMDSLELAVQVIADLSEEPENAVKLQQAKVVPFLAQNINDGTQSDTVVRYHAIRAIASFSGVEWMKRVLVDSGVVQSILGCIRSKSLKSASRYAMIAVDNLKYDASALKIQASIRGWMGRRKCLKMNGRYITPEIQRIRSMSVRSARRRAMQQRISEFDIRSRFVNSG